MSDTAASNPVPTGPNPAPTTGSTPPAETTAPGPSEPPGSTGEPRPPPPSSSDAPPASTDPPPPASTTPPPPPIDPTTTPQETSQEPPSTTDAPPTGAPEPSTGGDTTTPPPPPPPPPSPSPSPTSPPVTVITVTPSSVPDETITVTTTSLNTDPIPSSSITTSTPPSSSTSTSASISATAVPSTGGGLSQPAKIAIAIIIPIFAVVLIAFLGIFFWRRYKKRKDSEEMRRKEVEEYGYNPNNDVSGTGAPILGASNVPNHNGDMADSDGAGYRGWGNTAGGRKVSAPLSASNTATTNPGYTKAPHLEGGMASGMQQQYTPPSHPELYGSPVLPTTAPATADSTAIGMAESDDNTKIHSPDRHSKSPVLSSPTQRPSTADSSTIGAAAITGPSELDDGLQRGDSVASSRYTNATRRSDGSDHHGIPGGNGYMTNYHAADGTDYYNDVANPYAGDHEKFGKHLQKRQLEIPEYAASFVNYKGLKKLIKQLASSSRNIRSGANLPIRTPEGETLNDPQAALHANKTTFFFRLDREIEKVNAFYLQKQDELTVRLRTLIEKKDAMQSRTDAAAKSSAVLITLQEGFHQFGVDLNKLQQFVELNATGFSKILKKWDKSSKSRTKELYLSRAVEVQPCFNRDVISELSDRATTSLLELEAYAEGESIVFSKDTFASGASQIETAYIDAQAELSRAISSGNVPLLSEKIRALESLPTGSDILTHAFLLAIGEASEECLEVLSRSPSVDLKAKDGINERNALHEASNAGRLSIISTLLSKGVDVGQSDAYGRLPLHYAAMHGHVGILEALLAANPKTLDSMDLDNFTPLIHALHHNKISSIELLIAHKARTNPTSDKDYIPLNLACQHGLVEIADILLKNGAEILPDAEGLFPQHHVARRRHASSLLVTLQSFGANLNEFDKLNGWTPMVHAASEGNIENLKVLLNSGARLDLLDEKNLSALYYSAWEGHLECMKIIFDAGGILGVDALEPPFIRPSPASTQSSAQMVLDPDGIPDLALPPPILPLRRYGHNFLDKKTFVQLTFSEKPSEAVFFYQQGKHPAARLTISSKSSDIISKNMVLPLADDAKIVPFQIDSLEAFAIDFDIFATFGTKMIARAVALSQIFNTTNSSGHCVLPLHDSRSRVIGQLAFDFQIIKPFGGVPLEIAHFAPYWKATSQFDSRPLITGSSLSGEYVRLFVQITRDDVPVLFPSWAVQYSGLDIPVCSLTLPQFKLIGSKVFGESEAETKQNIVSFASLDDLYGKLQVSFLSLGEALALLPIEINLNLHVLYPNETERREKNLSAISDPNRYVDVILNTVFHHARQVREGAAEAARSIMFSGFEPSVCTALNWKQPNYPVFFCNGLSESDLASAHYSSSDPELVKYRSVSPMSTKDAVKLAKNNNLMGLICSAKLLEMVPALIHSVKAEGLVLISQAPDSVSIGPPPPSLMSTVDGVLLKGGILRFNETIDM
ncbi:hypothetical protein DRE_05080 [Drechslerella stenobrocha 248]|uniref:Ankyrin repeat protein nuc-2 n=1 Tax=Drechslerella stenobrocha 248 TaxID=1043628 RepID=W7I0J3_9PEZI|nr:hypothetical protein DRE_05080 [Drechslerella stenobrocha 248]